MSGSGRGFPVDRFEGEDVAGRAEGTEAMKDRRDDLRQRARRRLWPKPGAGAWLRALAGCAAAIVAGEIGIRQISRSWYFPRTPIREVRQYGEGISVYHFEADGLGTFGNRLTGEPEVAGAPTVVVLGDSHVLAESVRDEDTMGAVLERLARLSGQNINVRQYGWYGGSAPNYVAVAGELLKRFDPRWVITTLNWTDFGEEPLANAFDWRMEILPDLSIRLIDMRPPPGRREQLRDMLARSSLATTIYRRFERYREAGLAVPGGNTASVQALDRARITRASVRALRRAYQDRLLIVYLAVTQWRDTPDPDEQRLLAVCRQEKVECVSTSPETRAMLRDHGMLSRGFPTTQPGVGHLNEVGHGITGEVMWQAIAGRIAQRR